MPVLALLSDARRVISAMLFVVRTFSLFLICLLAASSSAFMLLHAAQAPVQAPAQVPVQVPAQSPSPQLPSPPAAPSGPVIVLDPAHGGTDSGARGESGIVERDIVLQVARSLRDGLERQGYRVVMTRIDDSNPSYDDRAAVANANRGAIFISLHISSTGVVGTVRAYYDQFAAPIAPLPTTTESTPDAGAQNPDPQAGGLVVWEEAQRPFMETSHHLADLVQVELAQLCSGSPDTSVGIAVRGLRSVAAPAIAIEISSVAATDPNSLTALAAPLTTAVARSLLAMRASSSAGAK